MLYNISGSWVNDREGAFNFGSVTSAMTFCDASGFDDVEIVEIQADGKQTCFPAPTLSRLTFLLRMP